MSTAYHLDREAVLNGIAYEATIAAARAQS